MNHNPKGPRVSRIALGAGGLCVVAQALLSQPAVAAGGGPTTPIEHLVVIFQENVSFDHYFATYPVALNPAGEPSFVAAPDTPPADNTFNFVLAPSEPVRGTTGT